MPRPKGLKHSEEVRRKISIGNTGKKMSKEAKEKIRIGLMGNKNTLGRKQSLEERRKHKKPNVGQFKIGQASVFRNKIRPNMTGRKHPQWKGGISFEKYSLDWTKTLKRSIRERDKYTCQLCSKQQEDRAFDVHHIDYNKKNCNPNNLITLCNSCHMKTNVNRKHWKTFFEQKGVE